MLILVAGLVSEDLAVRSLVSKSGNIGISWWMMDGLDR